MKAAMVAVGRPRRKAMTQFITPSELEHLSETELRSKLFHLAQELHRIEESNFERTLVLASIDNVHRALLRKTLKGPKGPTL